MCVLGGPALNRVPALEALSVVFVHYEAVLMRVLTYGGRQGGGTAM